MPTKPNKAGQQQNYVPAGNGDASGEYGDNATGSNKHFTNFKKPDENETEIVKTEETKTIKTFKKPEQEQPKQEETDNSDIKSVRKNATNKLIGKCRNPSRDNDITFQQVIEESNDEGVKILDEYLGQNNRLSIKFGSAGRNAAGRAFGYGDIDTNHDTHTIRHELGHTFDNWYGKDLPENNKGNFESQDYASVRYVDDETGKTMNETIHEELGVSMYKTTLKGWRLSYQKQGVDKREVKLEAANRINTVFNKYADKIFDEITGIPNSRETYNKLRVKYNEINSNLYKDLVDTEENKEYERLRSAVYKAENDYRDRMFRQGATSVYYSDSPEVRTARDLADKARQKYEELKQKTFREKFGEKELADYEKLAKNQYNVYSKMKGVAGLVGDTYDYLGVGSSFYTTAGHGEHYFKQRREAGYVLEIFANMFDCYMSNDTWKKDFVKEAFPETSKVFEKIYYKKGKK